MTEMFKEIKAELLTQNPFQAIGSEWMLVAAGSLKNFNMMTASWGGFGVLWHKNVCFCFIRPQRYTYEFVEQGDYFSLNFFDADYKSALQLCGERSGRDLDKAQETGLTPVEQLPSGVVYFNQARLVVICRKIYCQDIDPAHFLDTSIEENYPNKDYHRMYIGEVVRCLEKC